MKFHDFIRECFHGWSIAGITTCGTDCGNLKLRSGDTFVRVFFQLHGDTHWTGNNVTVDHIEAVEEII
jgi:hypothetical protein